MMQIAIINGPNLNLQGLREPSVYGEETFPQVMQDLRMAFPKVKFTYFQSNVEGLLIDEIQRVGFEWQGIVINAGGYSHTSVALHDALLAVPATAVEVHISNIFAREEYRHHSLLTNACCGMICGLGLQGYRLAVEYLLAQL